MSEVILIDDNVINVTFNDAVTNVELTAEVSIADPIGIQELHNTMAAVEADRAEVAANTLAVAANTLTVAEDTATVAADKATTIENRDNVIALYGDAAAMEAARLDTEASASEADASEAAALVSEQNAKASETAAAASESAAGTSEAKAAQWAERLTDTAVEPGLYSAKHHATKASESASAAGASESNAAGSASAASTSETNAANSAAAASDSEGNAAASESSAASSASSASTSASNANTSEANASDSASAASTSEGNALSYRSAAGSSANEASTSKTHASNSASAASASEANASNSASAASTSEGNAAGSAAAASNSEQNAATSAQNAAIALDQFTDQYLGPKSSEPTLDNDGQALQDGALYWNTTTKSMRVYDLGDGVWNNATAELSSLAAALAGTNENTAMPPDLVKAHVDSRIGTDPGKVPTNEDLGSAAYTDASDYATASQGEKADSALQDLDGEDASNANLTTSTGTQPLSVAVDARLNTTLLTKSVAGGTDVTLTATEASARVIQLTGALTANINVIVPDATREWLFVNDTSEAFTVTVKTSAGSGVVVTQGRAAELRSDGVNVIENAAINARLKAQTPGDVAGTAATQDLSIDPYQIVLVNGTPALEEI